MMIQGSYMQHHSQQIYIKLLIDYEHVKIDLRKKFPCGNEKVLASCRALFDIIYRCQFSKEAGKVCMGLKNDVCPSPKEN